jgi:hypothetical protein
MRLYGQVQQFIHWDTLMSVERNDDISVNVPMGVADTNMVHALYLWLRQRPNIEARCDRFVLPDSTGNIMLFRMDSLLRNRAFDMRRTSNVGDSGQDTTSSGSY